ncbi:hypothetical protein CCM_07116 [Cordyceps militaris CM01]|uniref:Uncharacterized protein n=1 Tax=Cordyceps militaris (strain CM01) TaxID=983644 RepID=G3JLX2_CORMM|nr:uncharacterized protein CCM_07116 [Cordyceps militaris CM01]EGX90696.1 hypothetical protein CCM_07116 [Cordyceps militaris CM01]
MKFPLVLAALFAGSLATVAQPGVGPPALGTCRGADVAIAAALAVLRRLLPVYPQLEPAIKAGVARFKNEIRCGPAPDEPEAPADDQMDCHGIVDTGIDRAAKVLRDNFGPIAPDGFDEGVTKGIKDFKKRLGCKPVVVDPEPAGHKF